MKKFATGLFVAVMGLGLAACGEQGPATGEHAHDHHSPAEHAQHLAAEAGEAVKETLSEAGETLKELGAEASDAIQENLEQAADQAKQLADDVEEGAKNVL